MSDQLIITPQDLANEWKRSGGLDLARKSILQEFMLSGEKTILLNKLDKIITTTLTTSSSSSSTSTSSLKSLSKKSQHKSLLSLLSLPPHSSALEHSLKIVESIILSREVEAFERKEAGKGRKKKRKEKGVWLGRELERLLRESRGDLPSDEEEEDEEEEEEEEEVEEEEESLEPVVLEKEDEGEVEGQKSEEINNDEDIEMEAPVSAETLKAPLLFGKLPSTSGLQFSLQFSPSPKKATLFSSTTSSASSTATSTPTIKPISTDLGEREGAREG